MPPRILVVDDEPDLELLVRQKFRRQIRKSELEFVFAHDGQEAIDKIKSDGNVDLVLTDINMPGMDGLTLLERLKELNKTLKSVVVSAYGDMANIRTAMNRGAYDFVTKPIDLDDLELTINKSIEDLRVLKEALHARDQLVSIRQELEVATAIQTSMLPDGDGIRSERAVDYDIGARMMPAKEVGGDLYDFFDIDEDRVGIVVGDVSGKGVPAALLMAVSRTLLRGVAVNDSTPSLCMAVSNNILVDQTLPHMFVTVFYGVFDHRTGTLEYCSAGHNPPMLLAHDGTVRELENVGGLAVGVMEEFPYESNTVTLSPGDTVIVYTDGVSEAMNPDDDQYGEERLMTCLGGAQAQPLPELIGMVFDDVATFAAGAPQSDDITCLALRWTGPKPGP